MLGTLAEHLADTPAGWSDRQLLYGAWEEKGAGIPFRKKYQKSFISKSSSQSRATSGEGPVRQRRLSIENSNAINSEQRPRDREASLCSKTAVHKPHKPLLSFEHL